MIFMFLFIAFSYVHANFKEELHPVDFFNSQINFGFWSF